MCCFAWFLTGYQTLCSLWISITLFSCHPEILIRYSDKSKTSFTVELKLLRFQHPWFHCRHQLHHYLNMQFSVLMAFWHLNMLHFPVCCHTYLIFLWSEKFVCLCLSELACFQDAQLWLTTGSSNQQCGEVAPSLSPSDLLPTPLLLH